MVIVELRNAIIEKRIANAIKSAAKRDKVKVAASATQKGFKKIEARKT